MTDLAWNVNIWQEVHFDGYSAIARTVLAAPAFYVK